LPAGGPGAFGERRPSGVRGAGDVGVDRRVTRHLGPRAAGAGDAVTGGVVRAAGGSDADGLARVQVASWQATLAGIVPDEVLAELTSPAAVAQFAERWLSAITAPPTSRHRGHVAGAEPGSPEVAGFAAAGPATDEDLWAGTDAELYELH